MQDPLTLYKLIVLYMLSKVDFALTKAQIADFLLNRETDAAEEVAQGLAFGLSDAGGRHKQIYNVFKYIDTGEHAQYTDFAKDLIGISSWSQIMY